MNQIQIIKLLAVIGIQRVGSRRETIYLASNSMVPFSFRWPPMEAHMSAGSIKKLQIPANLHSHPTPVAMKLTTTYADRLDDPSDQRYHSNFSLQVILIS